MESFRPYFFVILLLLFLCLELIVPKRAKSTLKRKGANIILFASGIALMRFIFPLGLSFFAELIIDKDIGFLNFYNLPMMIGPILTILLFDFSIYWQHRFSHNIPLLWRFHHVHHSDRAMDTTSALRFHPGEIFLSGLYKLLLILIIAPSVEVYLIYESLLGGFALFNHSNIRIHSSLESWLKKVLATPDFHSPHHSPDKKLTNSNYGNILSIWDYIFKTYEASGSQTYGLQDESPHNSEKIGHLLKKPFL